MNVEKMIARWALTLRPISYSDTENIVKWRNSPDVSRNLLGQDQLTAEMHENYMRTKVDTGLVVQNIIVHKDEIDIGTCFLKNIDEDRSWAESGLFIGEPKYLGTGAGFAASVLNLKYAWNEMNLNHVYCRVLKENTGALRVNEVIGYKIIDDPVALGIPDSDDDRSYYFIADNPNRSL